MKVPIEYDPYGMMLELFQMEAAEVEADQVLVVSRQGHSNLYFVSGNRVRRLVKLCSDISQDLALHIAHRSQAAAAAASRIPVKVVNSVEPEAITVSTKGPADVNCTMPMPALLQSA